MFSVWQRPQIVWGGGDEAGSGGEGSKGRSKNEMKTQREINARLAEREKQGFKGSAAFTPEINDLVAQRERDRAATARNTAGTKYTGLKDMFDGGGPGASGPQFRGGPFLVLPIRLLVVVADRVPRPLLLLGSALVRRA